MAKQKPDGDFIYRVALITFLVLIFGLIFYFKGECEASGGQYVRGVISFECIRR